MPDNREWIAETLAHRQPARVPYNCMFSPPALAALAQHYGVQTSLEEALDFPLRMNGCKSIKPLYADPDQFGQRATDEFGVGWSTSKIDRGSPVVQPLAEPDLTRYKFPDPGAPYRFAHLAEWCRQNAAHSRVLWIGDLWERATFMRGMEQLLLDWALNPRFVEELLRRLADHILRTMAILFARFEFEGVALSDDYGTQRGLLLPPGGWRQKIKPLLKEIYGLAQRHHKFVFQHSCGNVEAIIPDFIELGLDVLHPIQPETMDIYKLKREYGRQLCFCGGVRTQDLLPYGTPAEVRAEVRRLKNEMGRGGGYILEPGITLQADVPLANMTALLDEARQP